MAPSPNADDEVAEAAVEDTAAFGLPADELVDLFQTGDIEVLGRMPYSSNATLLVDVTNGPVTHQAIYKPHRGERPLWDFPDGLFKREVAMYRLCHQLGWDVIPPTTIGIGPHGEGSVQALINADFSQHYFMLHEAGIGEDDLHKICVLDLIANNTDRKSGHCMLAKDGRVYGIDNGLAFHAQWKLRTVMWDYIGEPISNDILADVARFAADGPAPELAVLLDSLENDAMVTRAKAIVNEAHYPDDETDGHRWPWPLV